MELELVILIFYVLTTILTVVNGMSILLRKNKTLVDLSHIKIILAYTMLLFSLLSHGYFILNVKSVSDLSIYYTMYWKGFGLYVPGLFFSLFNLTLVYHLRDS